MTSTNLAADPSLDDAREDHRAESVALGQAWAEAKAESYRVRVCVAEWPDFWDDADDGGLPPGLDPGELEPMRHAANRAARERWGELLADQRTSESDDGGPDEPGAAAQEVRVRESLAQSSDGEAWSAPPADAAADDTDEATLVRW